MKKAVKKLWTILLALAMTVSMLPAFATPTLADAAAAEPITVYLTVSNQGTLAKANDESLMAVRELSVTDRNEDGSITVDEALVAAHEEFNSADGYAVSGGFVNKLWGVETTNNLFFVNGKGLPKGVTLDTVSDGDYLVASVNKDNDYYSDYYSEFDKNHAAAEAGSNLTFTLSGYMGMSMNPEAKPLANIAVKCYNPQGEVSNVGKTDEKGQIQVPFAASGQYILTAEGDVANTEVTDWNLINLGGDPAVYGTMDFETYESSVAYTDTDYGTGPYPAAEVKYMDFFEWQELEEDDPTAFAAIHTLHSNTLITSAPIMAPACIVYVPYFFSLEKATIVNTNTMFKVKEAVLLGKDCLVTMNSASYDAVYVGHTEEAEEAPEEDLIHVDSNNQFQLSVPDTSEPMLLAFRSSSGKWYNRSFDFNLETGILTTGDYVEPIAELDGLTTDQAIAKADELATVPMVNSLIRAIKVQTRDENTDKYCAVARAYYDALNDFDKDLLIDPDYFGLYTGEASKDNPRNKDGIGDKELLVVSFGTSFNDSRAATINAIEQTLEAAYPDYSVRRAFTAQIIINHIQARDGEVIDNMTQALDRAVANGVKELLVQPTHLMHGAEYDEMCAELKKYEDKFKITVSEPLLSTDQDMVDVAEAVVDATIEESFFDSIQDAAAARIAVVLMGHGTAHEANVTYTKMQEVYQTLGMNNVFVGTVEGEPEGTSAEDTLAKVKAAGYVGVILRPLMVVAGDHANNDMAGDEADSWKSIFGAALGANKVICQINGLGEIATVRNLYSKHIADQLNVAPPSTLEVLDYTGDSTVPYWPTKDLVDTFGMFALQKGSEYGFEGDSYVLHVVPKNTTVYGGLHWGYITDENLTKDIYFNADGTFDITLDTKYVGKMIPIAPIKKSDGKTSAKQYYLAIPKMDSGIVLADKTVAYTGKTPAMKAEVTGSTGAVTFKYYSDAKCTKEVKNAVNVGTYYVTATVAADDLYAAATSAPAKLTITKAKNKMTAKGKTIKASASKTKTFKKNKAFKIKNATGKVTFKQVTKNKLISVNKKTGKVVVKPGLKAGKTYKITVKVTAKGNSNVKPVTKKVVLKVKVAK